ncbi:hypothetical protein N658DRAFT_145069 [Parathielavia hyrcaniae]|uniref:F-box domain-containing protein n=1 Tax=Parathielavia hyrcaniae TaxID=113614 RepID=A0AAN6PY13_9PEZI|nr:hypothetical protein N658DRAFT_145069 [Parathielavia hyrcaniae]
MIEVLHSVLGSPAGLRSPFSREERMMESSLMKESSLTKAGMRTPRRSQTQHEYFLPQSSFLTALMTPPQSPIAEDSSNLQSVSPREPSQQDAERSRTPARRPPLGPPRRSYSVTDQEAKVSSRRRRPASARGLALTDLPAELHYVVFDFLDPIDSTCLGLTNKHFYTIHRRLHGSVSLTARRDGPNDLEWAWHLAGNIVRKNHPVVVVAAEDGKDQNAQTTAALINGLGQEERNALSRLRVRGQGYCRMCGVTRCQLHKHIQEWLGEGFEYCSVRQRFGPVAPEGAKSYCYMSKPGDPRRCGRHVVRRDKVELR